MKKVRFSLTPETGRLSETDAKRYFSTVGFATFALMVLSHLGSYALSRLVYSLYPEMLGNAIATNLLSMIPIYGIAFPVFYLILSLLPKDGAVPAEMAAKEAGKGFCVAIMLMMAGNYVANIIVMGFEGMLGRSLINPVEEMTSGASVLVNLVFVALLAPILEELMFRKVLCDRLLPLGEGYAVVISAAIFGLAHGNFYQFPYAFLLGALFALVYIKTGKLIYSTVYHILINLLGGVFAPWLIGRLEPLINEEALGELVLMIEEGATDAILGMLGEYMLPLMLLAVYEIVMIVLSICGIAFLLTGIKKLRFRQGLLPPPTEGKVSNVFCNVGAAAALTAFAGVFVLSLL